MHRFCTAMAFFSAASAVSAISNVTISFLSFPPFPVMLHWPCSTVLLCIGFVVASWDFPLQEKKGGSSHVL